MEFLTLKQVVQQNIKLPNRPNSNGWYPVICKVCNDHGRKGPRAAFMFDQEKVAYHCFNCSHAAVYDPSEHRSLSDSMITVLESFEVPEDQWHQVILSAIEARDKYGVRAASAKVEKSFEPSSIVIPDFFVPLEDEPEMEQAIDYLEERGILYKDYSFLFPKFSNDSDYEKWKGRIIIPIYKGNTVVFYVGRDFTKTQNRKYLNPPIDRENIVYGFDQLDKDTKLPLYIVEGWFDAFVVDGVAVFGNRMTDGQIHWINQSERRKIVIPDRWGNGHLLAKQAIKLGWSVSTPEIGSCKDLNEAFVKYGKMYLLKTIAENEATGFIAETNISIYCRKSDDSRSGKRKDKEPH